MGKRTVLSRGTKSPRVKAANIDSDFLVHAPLYKKKNLSQIYNVTSTLSDFFGPIQAYCGMCRCERTFQNKSIDEFPGLNKPVNRADPASAWDGLVFKTNYDCSACNKYSVNFMVRLTVEETGQKYNVLAEKVGQWPSLDINIDRELSQKLGDHYEIFKKGRICEVQSYGIGAFGYYRRIIETIIGDLIAEIRAQIPEENWEKFNDAIREIESSHYASEKIELVTTYLPDSLKPGGRNPLALLYGVLSDGIHARTDEECLDIAIDVRETLENLVHLLNVTKQATKRLSDSTKRMLEKKSEKLE